MTDSDNPRRVLLKLSGEAFGGGKVGIDTQVIRRIAEEIVPAVQQGVQVAIVVGGGFGGVLGMFLGVPIFACISSLVNWFTNRSLTKKGVTDDAMFDPAPLASPDEKKD